MTDHRPYTGRSRTLLALIAICAGGVIGFSGVNLGLPGPGDESYQALCVADYRNNPLGMLAFFIGHLWQQLWGETVLSLRCLASLEMLLAIGLGCVCLWRRTGNGLLSSSVFAVSVIVARASAFQLYNWDSGSYLFDAVALVAIASFLHRGDARKALIAGVAVACMSLARVPSAVFAPIIFGFIWAGCRRHRFSARHTALVLGGYTVTAVASALVIITLMCGSPAEYIACFRPENLVGGHSPADLPDWIKRIGELGYNQMVWITPSAVAVAAGMFLYRLRPGHRWLRAFAVIFSVALAFVVYRHREAWCDFEWNSLGADLPLNAFLLLLFPVWNLTHERQTDAPRVELWWCAAMMVLVSFGSDTFFERMCGAFTIPVIVAVAWPHAPAAMRRLVRNVLLVSVAVFATVVAEQWVMKARFNTAVPPARYEALRGLRVRPADLRWLEINETAAQSARALGMRYVTCVNRFTPQLIFGRDNGPRLSLFHIDTTDPSLWPPEQTNAVNKARIIIYNESMPDDAPVFGHLRSLGFADVLHRDDVHIFARHAATAAINPETENL